MIKKLVKQDGFTMVEMVASALVLSFLAVMLGTGIALAQKSYDDVISNSEVQLLSDTALDAIANEMRFARDIKEDNSGNLKSYTSDKYGKDSTIAITDGKLTVNSKRILPTGAYANGKYELEALSIEHKNSTFKIKFFIKDRKNSKKENMMQIRCIHM